MNASNTAPLCGGKRTFLPCDFVAKMAALFRATLCLRSILSKVKPISYQVRLPLKQNASFAPPCCTFSEKICTRHLATESPEKRLSPDFSSSSQSDLQKLDRALYRLDSDVRRTGRIYLRDVEDIFQEIKRIGTATSTQSLLVIRCCGSLLPEEKPEFRSKLVSEIWDAINQLGIQIDVSHYNALLKVYLENEFKFSPTEFLSDMEKKGIEPNRVTYQRLIAHYCQQGDIDGAGKILEFMKGKDLPINENVFNALVQGHARANDLESANGILEVMRNSALDPTSDTYAVLACCYAEKGDIAGIRKVISDAESRDVLLLDRDLMDVIYTLSANGHDQHADEIIGKLRKHSGYNQDAVSTILRVINREQVDVAYKLFLTMPKAPINDRESQIVSSNNGAFFIRQLVKANIPLGKIMSICEDMKTRGLNESGLKKAAEMALTVGKTEMATHLFEALKSQGVPLRPHYFWPVISSHRKNNNEKGVYETINLMSSLDVMLSFDTLLDYVYPALNMHDPDLVIQKLKEMGHSTASIIGPMVTLFVGHNNIVLAQELITKYPIRLLPNPLLRYLASAYSTTKNLESTLAILSKVDRNIDSSQKSDWVGQFVLDFLTVSERDATKLEPLLKGLANKGMKISHATIELVHSRVKDIPESVTELLDKLATSEVNLPPIEVEADALAHPREMSVEELESHLLELKSKGMNTRGVLRRLFLQHCANNNLTRVAEIKAELDSQNFVYTSAMKAQLMDMYCFTDKLEEALAIKKNINQLDPSFRIDPHKIINLATLLARQDRVDEAVTLLKDHHTNYGVRVDRREYMVRNAWHLLIARADKGDVDGTKRLFETLHSCGYIDPVNALLGPLIKAHLLNEDLQGAVEEFGRCCKLFRHTPWKNEIILKLINSENADQLQKIVDLSSDIHGEMNTLHDLAFCFVEAGRIKQAKKILDTPGLRARQHRIDVLCERLIDDGKVEQLENVVAITRDIFDIDRDKMYFHLLRAYCKAEDPDKALGVWTSMQEENVQPSDTTLVYLAQFLETHKRPIPFSVPKGASKYAAVEGGLMKAVQNGDIDAALSMKHDMESGGNWLSYSEASAVIELLLQRDRLGEATEFTKEMLDKQMYPVPNVLKFLLIKLSQSGKVDDVRKISQSLPADIKRSVNLKNYSAVSYIKSDRHEELLEQWEKNIPAGRDDLPIGSILSVLDDHPDSLQRITKIGEEYLKHDFHNPLNMVWMHHMLKERYDVADQILLKAPEFQEKLLFRNIVQQARTSLNETMARRLVSVVTPTKLSSKSKGLAYGCLVEILIRQNKQNEAMQVINNAAKIDVTLGDLPKPVVVLLRESFVKEGKPVPFEMPEFKRNKKDVSNTSSDSSDDESERK